MGGEDQKETALGREDEERVIEVGVKGVVSCNRGSQRLDGERGEESRGERERAEEDNQGNQMGKLVHTEVGPTYHVKLDHILNKNLNYLEKLFVQVDINLLKDLVLEHNLFNLEECNKQSKKWSVDHHPHQQLQEEILATMLNIRRASPNLPWEKVGKKYMMVEFDPKVGKYRHVFKPKQRFSYRLGAEI